MTLTKHTILNSRTRGRWVLGAAAAVALGITIGMTSALHATSTQQRPQLAATSSLPASFADLVDYASPSVVAIRTMGPAKTVSALQLPPGLPFAEQFRRYFEYHGRGASPVQGAGSGFIIDADGLIVTNHHVIENAKEIMVVLSDGQELKASVKGIDKHTDLALLSVEADKPLQAVSFGDSDAARVGDWVVAVGSPFGLGGSFTAGIISARGRDIQSGPYDDFFQIDAPINRGNSGGALFNTAGEVVGVNTAIFSPNGGNVGIGFAVPSNQAAAVIADLKQTGQVARGWLGVTIQAMGSELAQSLGLDDTDGALVASVGKTSPAEKAGLRPGDVIRTIEGESLTSTRDVTREIAEAGAGETVKLGIWRKGESVIVDVELGQRPGDDRQLAELSPSHADTQALGLTLEPLKPGSDPQAGVLITDVQAGSEAAARQLRPGMVIRMVEGEAVESPQAIANLLSNAKAAGKRSIWMLVESETRRGFVALPVG